MTESPVALPVSLNADKQRPLLLDATGIAVAEVYHREFGDYLVKTLNATIPTFAKAVADAAATPPRSPYDLVTVRMRCANCESIIVREHMMGDLQNETPLPYRCGFCDHQDTVSDKLLWRCRGCFGTFIGCESGLPHGLCGEASCWDCIKYAKGKCPSCRNPWEDVAYLFAEVRP